MVIKQPETQSNINLINCAGKDQKQYPKEDSFLTKRGEDSYRFQLLILVSLRLNDQACSSKISIIFSFWRILKEFCHSPRRSESMRLSVCLSGSSITEVCHINHPKHGVSVLEYEDLERCEETVLLYNLQCYLLLARYLCITIG